MSEESVRSRGHLGAVWLRWTARFLALLSLSSVLMFVIGEGVPAPWNQPVVVQIEMFSTALMLLGLAAGWRWERTGALLIVAGWMLFAVAERGWPPLLFTGFLVVAVLYACLGFQEKRRGHDGYLNF